ncbi:hypothetical protein VNO78_15645 [Psophocarpus tetragonolobus]|uniref:Uncharacterized protein n=1 Tax=Psophocarpus tetragonolobus TaxID=3891 RepID=A0AAN9SEC3_PSOTE
MGSFPLGAVGVSKDWVRQLYMLFVTCVKHGALEPMHEPVRYAGGSGALRCVIGAIPGYLIHSNVCCIKPVFPSPG